MVLNNSYGGERGVGEGGGGEGSCGWLKRKGKVGGLFRVGEEKRGVRIKGNDFKSVRFGVISSTKMARWRRSKEWEVREGGREGEGKMW